MIIGAKKELNNYKSLNCRIAAAIDFIMLFDENKPDGRYEIDGDNLYANVVTINASKDEKVVFEAHKKYIDLQYVISGSECMVYAQTEKCSVTKQYTDDSDYLLLEGNGNKMVVNKNDFYIVYPFDAHAPGHFCGDEKIRKIIVKIKL